MNEQNHRPTGQQTRPAQNNASRYDMYATFRTKERADLEKRRSTGEPSIYDNYRAKSADFKHSVQKNAATQNRTAVNRHAQNAVRPDAPPRPPQRSGKPKKDTATSSYGTRVQSEAGSAYRYGFHSSYRTADGRILDGFDKTGRPIYRDPYASDSAGSAGSVILHDGAAVAMGEHKLRPVRRARIVTLDDTEKKPFPWKIVMTVLTCTALVMLVLYTYMDLNEQTNTLSSLSYQLSSLRSRANTLQAEVVRREDLISIEQTAADILGMVKTDVLTKQYVSIENEDKTEVVANLAEDAIRRVTVEIDLDTGKPMQKDDSAATFTPADKTETTDGDT